MYKRQPEQLAAVRREIHLLLKQANYDLAKFQFNTVASAAMKMLNSLETVSYTHLDVYKRQVLGRAARRPRLVRLPQADGGSHAGTGRRRIPA